jgi:rSAM/selenodomain-associated transferase 1
MQASVLVFAKAPVPGQVKTRLIPALGAESAARLHRHLLWQTLQTACLLPQATVQLWCAPDTTHAYFAECARDFPLSLHEQRGQDLGARMFHALQSALINNDAALLIGADCPLLDVNVLHAARAALSGSTPAVLVPAEDGGYVLIGLKRLASDIFADIDWGTCRVLNQTRARLRQLGWSWHELPALRDIDRPEDLHAFPTLRDKFFNNHQGI